ncbi:ABC transporter permease subunit [Rhodococcus sp. YH1]|uniref:ABC transporter permease subunit n=1 Tax=Rhodococcus sp. YH1 TaxID=89066 RepID=UPI001386BD02|nr:Glutathione transport system permease protein GsiC [Rhodococcus sp. YH1]
MSTLDIPRAAQTPTGTGPTLRSAFHVRWPLSPRYLVTRLVVAVTAVFAVISLVFVCLVATGNPAQLLVGTDATVADIERLSAQLGFDRPWYEQYLTFVRQILSGDLPASIRYGESAVALVVERIPASLVLGATGLLLGTLVGLGAGYLASVPRGGSWRQAPITALTALDAIPSFFLGVLLIYVFAVTFGLLPSSGAGSPASLVLPALTLTPVVAAPVARVFRSSLIDTHDLDHVRFARSKGVHGTRLALRHTVGNALGPVVNVIGVQSGMVLGGAIITETLFSWPGVGQLAISAINNRDYPVVLAAITFVAIGFIVINLVVDLIGAALDPRSVR